jgi:hypothetical protein
MKAVKQYKPKQQASSSTFRPLEMLEDRRMMAITWIPWATILGQDKVAANYPWLDGGGNGVAVIDKGIDYWHPALGGNRTTSTKSPRIVNVHDYRDGDNDPFPSESQVTDPTSAHGTGVASILAGLPIAIGGKHFEGILQNSLLYNLRTNRFDSQNTIKLALDWVVANHVQYHITAINLTDFIGTSASTPVYASEVQALWNAGVFIATPCANDWNNPDNPKQPIGYPAKSPYIFGTGGAGVTINKVLDSTVMNPKTQRGPGLDILSQSTYVTIPYYTPSTDSDVYVINGGEGNSWGTPTVTGTAVLIQQIDPTITPQEIMQILQDSGVPYVDPDGTGTYARLDMYAAINLAYNRRDDIYDQGKGGSDDFAHAGVINLDSNNQGHIDNLKLLIHDHDYYTFTVDSPADFTIKIGLQGSSTQPPAEVLDADGNLVGTMVNGVFDSHRLPAGQYYIHLYDPNKSLVGTYSVNVNQDPSTPPPPGAPGKDGTFNDVAYDKDGNLNFVWFDSATHSLKYAKRNSSKVWSSVQIVDQSSADVGDFVSMSLDSAGRPGLAYYDGANADLKYAHFNGSSWDVQPVDQNFTTGYYPSIKYDSAGRPVIAYYYKTSGDLRLATYNHGVWSTTTIDSKGDVGRYPSLALNPATGRWAVAYEHTGAGSFKFAQQVKGGAWSIATVDSPGNGGGFISLAFDKFNQPAFSYYDAKNADLKFAQYNGRRWNTSIIAAKNSQGLYTNLFFDPGNSGLPVIYYFNKTNDSLMDARNNGTGWDYEVLATGGGRHNHVTQDADAFEHFAWLDDSSGDLKVADL